MNGLIKIYQKIIQDCLKELNKRSACLIICAALILPTPVLAETAATPTDNVDKFVFIYKCAVAGALERIRAHAPTDDHVRYLIIDADNMNGYVQCNLHDNDTAIYCEAASGFYGPHARVSPDALSFIAQQGFSTDASIGNFQFDVPVKNGEAMDGIADHMLQTLYRGMAHA